jgi:hypothetical protein
MERRIPYLPDYQHSMTIEAVADYLRWSKQEFIDDRDALEIMGFPLPHPDTGKYCKAKIDDWALSQDDGTHTAEDRTMARLYARGLRPKAARGIGYVYFFADAPGTLLKIGYASDPLRRLRELQTAAPSVLMPVCVAPGGVTLEKALHEKFEAEWAHGEWFEFSDRIRSYLDFAIRVGYAPHPEFDDHGCRKAGAVSS